MSRRTSALSQRGLDPAARDLGVGAVLDSHPNAFGAWRTGVSRSDCADRPDRARDAGDRLQRAEHRRQEVLVRVAVGEHQPPEALGVARRDELADRAAGVVADQGHVLELERVHEVGDDPRQPGGVRSASGRIAVRCEPSGQSGAMQRCSPSSSGTTLRHSVAVGEEAVDEQDRVAAAAVAVADRARRRARRSSVVVSRSPRSRDAHLGQRRRPVDVGVLGGQPAVGDGDHVDASISIRPPGSARPSRCRRAARACRSSSSAPPSPSPRPCFSCSTNSRSGNWARKPAKASRTASRPRTSSAAGVEVEDPVLGVERRRSRRRRGSPRRRRSRRRAAPSSVASGWRWLGHAVALRSGLNIQLGSSNIHTVCMSSQTPSKPDRSCQAHPGGALGGDAGEADRRRPPAVRRARLRRRRHRGDRARRRRHPRRALPPLRRQAASCSRRSTSRSRARSPRGSRRGALGGSDPLEALRAGRRDVPRRLPRARGAAHRPARRAGGAGLGALARDRGRPRARPDRGGARRGDGGGRRSRASRCARWPTS